MKSSGRPAPTQFPCVIIVLSLAREARYPAPDVGDQRAEENTRRPREPRDEGAEPGGLSCADGRGNNDKAYEETKPRSSLLVHTEGLHGGGLVR